MNKELLLYVKKLSKSDKKTLSQKALKAAEEVGELAKAVLPFDNAYATNHRFVERQKILEEAADTILTALSVAYDLDFNNDEIESMMWEKTLKWDTLQRKEQDLKYPVPYEIHITVSLPDYSNVESTKQTFLEACAKASVKPIVLDLSSASGEQIRDVMTSSKHLGTNSTAYRESERIATVLRTYHLSIVRIKIETVPWHPAAPQNAGDVMPANCYFEAHIPFLITSKASAEELEVFCKRTDLHLSRNAFKVHGDGSFTVMATYRKYTGTYKEFQAAVEKITSMFDDSAFAGKTITEFSIYDTKISHDFPWMLSSEPKNEDAS